MFKRLSVDDFAETMSDLEEFSREYYDVLRNS